GWRELIPERVDRVIAGFQLIAGLVATDELEGASSRLRLYDPGSGELRRDVPLPALGSLGGVGGESDGDALYVNFSSFAQVPTTYRVDPATGAGEPFAAGLAPVGLDPSRFEVEQ